MVFKFAGGDASVLLVSEGLGAKKWHGRIVILVNEHTVSAGEMAAAFAAENHLATIVGTVKPDFEVPWPPEASAAAKACNNVMFSSGASHARSFLPAERSSLPCPAPCR